MDSDGYISQNIRAKLNAFHIIHEFEQDEYVK